jgi:hypothetical protein
MQKKLFRSSLKKAKKVRIISPGITWFRKIPGLHIDQT